MRWEQLTSPDFSKAVQETGVCILTLGVLERHSEHLPLGTDYINAHSTACLAAEKSPAVVFPPFYFGQIYEARCFPGTLTLRPTLLLDLIQSVIAEIGRNGFKKIILYNGHGGNIALNHFIAQCSLYEQKPYSVYLCDERLSPERHKEWQSILETTLHGHACECETSLTLANVPDWVKMERIQSGAGDPQGKLAHLEGNYSGIWWYADYPSHYAGDARTATIEKGMRLRTLMVDSLADFITAVKADRVVPALENEFFERTRQVST
jgi:creatinine amidohydrolase